MTKYSLTTPYGFDFIDHEHNTVTPHLVGHEVETNWGNSLLLDNHNTFELDGVDVWKHLKQNGISAETERKEASVWTRKENLDAVFTVAMAFARTSALNDEGGAFGKQIRTAMLGKK